MQRDAVEVGPDDTDVFVFTRFGVGVTDPAWLETRLKLFEAITLPSLAAQTDQRFHWSIFVGPEPVDWVVRRLHELGAPLANRFEIIRTPQRAAEMHRTVLEHQQRPFMITGIIDDDDAWHTETIAWARRASRAIAGEGVSKFGFTFERGYEWLITDLVDIDSLLVKGEKVLRRAAAYPYVRPFLGTSCFTFSRHTECFQQIGGMHASHGDNLRAEGFEPRILEAPEPAWLYVRHQQADSSIRKARGSGAADLSLADLSRLFGINRDLVERFRAEAASIQYAAKRTHKRTDKSQLTFDVAISGDFRYEDERVTQGKSMDGGRYVFNPKADHGIVATECRLVIFDNRKKEFCLTQVIRSDRDFEVFPSMLPQHLDCKYKLQIEQAGKWKDHIAYGPLVVQRAVPLPDAPSRLASDWSSTARVDSEAAPVAASEASLDALDLQLLQTASLWDLSSQTSRKASNEALFSLFLRLHAVFSPGVVFEVGACDARFSRQVRSRVPHARLFAFEANPHNYAKFRNHAELVAARVEYIHSAVADQPGRAPFFIQRTRGGKPISLNTGSNSMLERLGDVDQDRIEVPATSIDSFIRERGLSGSFSAWIDVEGANRQILAGMRESLGSFMLLHCEVEERAHWKDQWLWPDVLRFLGTRGFVPIARDFEYTTQHNVILVRRDLFTTQQCRLALTQHYSSVGRAFPTS